ncbi:MAG: Uma2 family endonuclease, partial [Gammaproteobacteria bacterium]
MSRPHPLPRYTFEDYDSFDRGPNGERFELVDGAIIAMVGGISAYNLIISNIQMALNNAVRSPCRVYRETFRLRVNDDSFYPDIFITCQPIAPNATQATDASVVVEVASDSTR